MKGYSTFYTIEVMHCTQIQSVYRGTGLYVPSAAASITLEGRPVGSGASAFWSACSDCSTAVSRAWQLLSVPEGSASSLLRWYAAV